MRCWDIQKEEEKKQILTDKEEGTAKVRERLERLKRKKVSCFGLLCLHYQPSSLRHIERERGAVCVSDSGEDKR